MTAMWQFGEAFVTRRPCNTQRGARQTTRQTFAVILQRFYISIKIEI
jgi:hypothetical protein